MPDYIMYYNPSSSTGRNYGLSNLIGDVTMTCLTLGLWLIWWILREMEKNRVRGYGLTNLIGDLTLTIGTFGLWGIWWIIREIRR